MDNIRYDISQFYPMKAVLERLFGKRCYRKLKETATLKDWKVEIQRLLRGIEVALDATVDVADNEWRVEMKQTLRRGRSLVSGAESITDLFAHLSATLVNLVFLQIGHLPVRASVEIVPLSPKYWQLNAYRSVQYVQSKSQAENLERQPGRRKTNRTLEIQGQVSRD